MEVVLVRRVSNEMAVPRKWLVKTSLFQDSRFC